MDHHAVDDLRRRQHQETIEAEVPFTGTAAPPGLLTADGDGAVVHPPPWVRNTAPVPGYTAGPVPPAPSALSRSRREVPLPVVSAAPASPGVVGSTGGTAPQNIRSVRSWPGRAPGQSAPPSGVPAPGSSACCGSGGTAAGGDRRELSRPPVASTGEYPHIPVIFPGEQGVPLRLHRGGPHPGGSPGRVPGERPHPALL